MRKVSKKKSQDVPCVTAVLPSESVQALFEVMDGTGFTPTAWHDTETDHSRVDLYPNAPEDIAHTEQALLAATQLLGIKVEPQLVTVAQDDWDEGWKRFFHVAKVSERIVVRPSWEEYTAKAQECVITIDPGLSFGTGQHATTKACLMLLDRLAREDVRRSVLDMGCGSGILAIAACLLGFQPVSAFDNDGSSVRVALENGLINGVNFNLYQGDLAHPQPPADIVLANIMAPVLIRFAQQIVSSMTPGPQARLAVSGILAEQYPAVRAAYEAQGLVEIETVLVENWRSALFQRLF